jgi:twinkle protein
VNAVQDAVNAAQPYPIEGVQYVNSGVLEQLYKRPAAPVLTTGVSALDDIMKLPGEGRLMVVTGIPNHGKSSLVTFIMVRTARKHSRRWAVFSPEHQPWEDHASHCAQILIGKPFRSNALPEMTAAERAKAEEWLKNRIIFLVSDAEDASPTLDWILERAKALVLRDGITDLLIDPWNEVEHQRGVCSETDYIGRSLQRLKAFGYRHGCNVWIVAHPTKLNPAKPGEKLPPPSLYDISGSSNWANKADLAFTVHTPGSITEVHLRKARFSRWGLRNAMAELEFDPVTGRYRNASIMTASHMAEAAD